MFCNRCGKQIDYDATVCNECLQEERRRMEEAQRVNAEHNANPTPYPAKEKEGSVMTGFGKALASTIMGFVGEVFVIIALYCGLILLGVSTDPSLVSTFEFEYFLGVAIMTVLISVGLAIASLILGVKSLKLALAEKKEGRKFPIPTMVLGICGMCFAVAIFMIALMTILFLGLI